MIKRLIYILPVLVLLSACAGPSEKPKSIEDLGIATPAHPVNNPSRIESPPGEPMQLPVNAPAVPRATDAGAHDEGGPLEPVE